MALVEEALPKALWDLPLPSPAHGNSGTSAERLSLKVQISAFRVTCGSC